MVDVEASAELDVPSGVGADLAVVDFVVEAEGEGHIAIGEGLSDFIEFEGCFGLLSRVFSCGNQFDGLDCADFYNNLSVPISWRILSCRALSVWARPSTKMIPFPCSKFVNIFSGIRMP